MEKRKELEEIVFELKGLTNFCFMVTALNENSFDEKSNNFCVFMSFVYLVRQLEKICEEIEKYI